MVWENDILLEQRYAPGDDRAYVESILPAIRDPRYIRIDGRPLLMVYRPGIIPNIRQLVAAWRDHFIAAGAGNPYLVMAQTFNDEDPRPYGLDAAAGFPPHNCGFSLPNERNRLQMIDKRFEGVAVPYEKVITRALANNPMEYRTFPRRVPTLG